MLILFPAGGDDDPVEGEILEAVAPEKGFHLGDLIRLVEDEFQKWLLAPAEPFEGLGLLVYWNGGGFEFRGDVPLIDPVEESGARLDVARGLDLDAQGGGLEQGGAQQPGDDAGIMQRRAGAARPVLRLDALESGGDLISESLRRIEILFGPLRASRWPPSGGAA